MKLVIGRVKVVEQEFQTREDAMKYMAIHAIEILETNTTFGEIDLPRPENTVRKGLDRRKGDAKDADFIRVFGFRGVEFGNWNNQAERQELLNDAFDGLMDLAEILNIPPAAISLNGELALAFGARGQGLSGAKAHYEPERAVINLTKLNGAGSLAHEWWHALDHYFGRQASGIDCRSAPQDRHRHKFHWFDMRSSSHTRRTEWHGHIALSRKL